MGHYPKKCKPHKIKQLMRPLKILKRCVRFLRARTDSILHDSVEHPRAFNLVALSAMAGIKNADNNTIPLAAMAAASEHPLTLWNSGTPELWTEICRNPPFSIISSAYFYNPQHAAFAPARPPDPAAALRYTPRIFRRRASSWRRKRGALHPRPPPRATAAMAWTTYAPPEHQREFENQPDPQSAREFSSQRQAEHNLQTRRETIALKSTHSLNTFTRTWTPPQDTLQTKLLEILSFSLLSKAISQY